MSDSASSVDFLAEMSASSRQRVSLARAQLGDAEIQARALDTPAPPRLQLSARRFVLIAEVKFRSPAAGQLRAGSEEQVNARVAGYAEAGAAAVSVLTEPVISTAHCPTSRPRFVRLMGVFRPCARIF